MGFTGLTCNFVDVNDRPLRVRPTIRRMSRARHHVGGATRSTDARDPDRDRTLATGDARVDLIDAVRARALTGAPVRSGDTTVPDDPRHCPRNLNLNSRCCRRRVIWISACNSSRTSSTSAHRAACIKSVRTIQGTSHMLGLMHNCCRLSATVRGRDFVCLWRVLLADRDATGRLPEPVT